MVIAIKNATENVGSNDDDQTMSPLSKYIIFHIDCSVLTKQSKNIIICLLSLIKSWNKTSDDNNNNSSHC